LFSVSTTTNKPPAVLRARIEEVLHRLGVVYKAIPAGFSCLHRPSIDLNSVLDKPLEDLSLTATQKRKLSFSTNPRPKISSSTGHAAGGAQTSARMSSPRGRRSVEVQVKNDTSNDSVGEKITSNLGSSMILRFEILVVKVALLNMHGVQFKKLRGDTWQFKNLASRILQELRL
jgi:hypothetical protein